MRDGPRGDSFDARPRDRRDRGKVHASRRFELDAAPRAVAQAHRTAEHCRRHVVEEHDVDEPRGPREDLRQLAELVDFDLDEREAPPPCAERFEPRPELRERAERGEMIVLHEHCVGEPESMKEPPARANRELLEESEPGCRLPRVVEARAAPPELRHERRRLRGDAAQAAEKIEHATLDGEHVADAAFEHRHGLARAHARTVAPMLDEEQIACAARGQERDGIHARERARLARHESCPTAPRGRNRRAARHVSGAEILGEEPCGLPAQDAAREEMREEIVERQRVQIPRHGAAKRTRGLVRFPRTLRAMASIFTRIIKGEIPGHKVYEDDHVVAFLDIGPLSRGHVLVVPREEKANLHELSDDSAAALGKAIARVAGAVTRVANTKSYNVLINTGSDAGQLVMHVHAHVIPKHADGSGLRKEWKAGKLDAVDGAALADSIRAALTPTA